MIADPLLKSAPPVAWACYLGCTTAARLAREWRITKAAAAKLLNQANLDGHIVRLRRGVYGPPVNSSCATSDTN